MDQLAERIANQDQRALARAITLIENDHPDKLSLMSALNEKKKAAHYIGITGSPGAGKSSLVDQMITLLREKGYTIAVIAVDPTSPFSGGALLGDRVRMHKHFTDEDVFIRSMATRGSLGGLARATKDAIRACDAYGFDYIFVETVGVGQSELDIMKVADTTAVMLTPNSGDILQIFKAGIMEIANLFILNKADLPGVKKLKNTLKDLIHIAGHRGFEPIMVETSVNENFGFTKLFDAFETHREYLDKTEAGQEKRQEQLRYEVYELIQEALWKDVHHMIEQDKSKRQELKQVNDPYQLAQKWLSEWKRVGESDG
ncbi:methylmalonyl Co-A mutase-associated GTPase MeaB [Tenuibacillus multivorans]|uniref:LAO/AO transport system kinase n=1 Tax=Tenuibacillus multivorans TaxID=237069 RepID=A0A1G9WZY2_9BACI|nr:methylmalonyl Co-A mutase-associated GTPase MeaB [Tenuibacillus multivorans]GEL77281.1 methylmalonyl Co-A mutase-associated GTPase MeaB [Tenuibacillus multivorans]SDM90134.1 LAO/AO transport system kinase [Tenuibacillus multivorans]